MPGGGGYTPPSSGGNVVGPASATDNAIARFNGTGGKAIQNSAPTIDDNGNLTIPSPAGTLSLISNGLRIYSGGTISIRDSVDVEQALLGSLGEFRPKILRPYGTGGGDVVLMQDGGARDIGSYNRGAVGNPAHYNWATATAEEYVQTLGPVTRRTSTAFSVRPGGSGSDLAAVGGLLNSQTNAVGNVGAGEDTLHTYTLPANTLGTNGRGVRIRATGEAANNANAKTLRIYFGAWAYTVSFTTSVATYWEFELDIIRTGASAQTSRGRFLGQSTTPLVLAINSVTQGTDPAEDTTAAIVIQVTGQATANSDIQELNFSVEAF